MFAKRGRNSLYFWTGQRPPTGLNTTFWPFLLQAGEQERIVRAIEQRNRVCVIDEPYPVPLPREGAPLVQYIADNFKPATSNGPFSVWTSKGPASDQQAAK